MLVEFCTKSVPGMMTLDQKEYIEAISFFKFHVPKAGVFNLTFIR